MVGANRPTVRTPNPPDVWPWPLARGDGPFGAEPNARIRSERSIYSKVHAGAHAAAVRACAGRLPGGAADRDALFESVKGGMEPYKSRLPPKETPPAVDVPEGQWVTPGATPMEPTPSVPSGFA